MFSVGDWMVPMAILIMAPRHATEGRKEDEQRSGEGTEIEKAGK